MTAPNHPPNSVTTTELTAAQVERIVAFFQSLQPSSVAHMDGYYTADAYFKDPFNEVRGLAAVQQIFSHMYVSLDRPHFVVTDRVVQGAQCFLVWDFKFHFKRFDTTVLHTVRGTSHLRMTPEGLITYHRDYWDAAEELYEKLPVVRVLMRWLKRRANT